MNVLLVDHDVMLPEDIIASLKESSLQTIFDDETLEEIVSISLEQYNGTFVVGFEHRDSSIEWNRYKTHNSYSSFRISIIDSAKTISSTPIRIPKAYHDSFIWGRIICRPSVIH
jgi:hypothetical protein